MKTILRQNHKGALLLFIAFLFGAVDADLVDAQEFDPEVIARLEALESEVAAIHAAVNTPPAATDWASAPTIPCLPNPPATCDSKFPTVQLGGFFQADAGWFDQSPRNINSVGDIQDGADFRRARLNAHGQAWHQVAYMIEFDFGFPGRPSFMDVYLDIQDTPVGTLRVGQWRQPFGMDGQTSVKEMTFLERGLPFAFLPFRQIGIGLFDTAFDESMTWAVSGFRFPTDPFGGNVGDNGGYGMATRVTALAFADASERHLIHVGGGYSFGDPANDVVRYRSQPEFFISETGGADLVPSGVPSNVPPFVDTDAIDCQNFNLFSAEGGLVLGSLYAQSEAIYASVERIGASRVSFFGTYAYAGYFLTGETRSYNRKSGVFGRVKPLRSVGCGGIGAWEVAVRGSYIDLDDADVLGGRLTDVTAGLNWYLNPNTKFQLNYIHAFLDDAEFGESEAGIVGLRGQVDF